MIVSYLCWHLLGVVIIIIIGVDDALTEEFATDERDTLTHVRAHNLERHHLREEKLFQYEYKLYNLDKIPITFPIFALAPHHSATVWFCGRLHATLKHPWTRKATWLGLFLLTTPRRTFPLAGRKT